MTQDSKTCPVSASHNGQLVRCCIEPDAHCPTSFHAAHLPDGSAIFWTAEPVALTPEAYQAALTAGRLPWPLP